MFEQRENASWRSRFMAEQGSLPDGNEVIQTLGFNGQHEPFRIRIEIRRHRRQTDGVNSRLFQYLVELRGVLAATVVDTISGPVQASGACGQTAYDVGNPFAGGMRRHIGNEHSAGLQMIWMPSP